MPVIYKYIFSTTLIVTKILLEGESLLKSRDGDYCTTGFWPAALRHALFLIHVREQCPAYLSLRDGGNTMHLSVRIVSVFLMNLLTLNSVRVSHHRPSTAAQHQYLFSRPSFVSVEPR
jgi:hypothetical protein